jgi:hypothetical protein
MVGHSGGSSNGQTRGISAAHRRGGEVERAGSLNVFVPSLQVKTSLGLFQILLLSFDALFPLKLEHVIVTAVPLNWRMAPPLTSAVLSMNSDPLIVSDDDRPSRPLAMAPPASCQKNNNETIQTSVSVIVRKKHLKICTQQGYEHRASLTDTVFPTNSDPVITIDPKLRIAPPYYQKHNNKTIQAAVLEIGRNEAFEV